MKTNKVDSMGKKIQKVDEQLIIYISKYLKKPVEEIRKELVVNLNRMKENLPQEMSDVYEKQELLENIKYHLGEKSKFEEIKGAKESEKKDSGFLEMEKRVLVSLSPKKREIVAAIHRYSLETDGAYFEISYRQFIAMLDNEKVQETQDSVKFLYANKELYKQELQLPLGSLVENDPEDTSPDNWPINDRKFRRTTQKKIIHERILDKKNENNKMINMAKNKLKKDGKYIATRDNAFAAIFDGLEGNVPQQIRTIQYFTEFVGKVIAVEKSPFCVISFEENKENTDIYGNFTSNIKGSLLIAKDC